MHRILLVGIMTLMLVGMYVYKLNAAELVAMSNKPSTTLETQPQKTITPAVKKVKPISVKEKKRRFLATMIKPLDRVYKKLVAQQVRVQELIANNPKDTRLNALKAKYKVKTNEALLIAIKPHPKSVALAQAAMESAWGTSRFFKKANNIFGVWSVSKKDKRIAASEKRGKQTIWLKKYDSIEESIEDYYLTLSRSKAFVGFKKVNSRVLNPNPYALVKKLDRYSERGALYGKELAAMIRYNKFIRFDDVAVKQTVAKAKTSKPVQVANAVAQNESSFADVLSQIKEQPLKSSQESLTKN